MNRVADLNAPWFDMLAARQPELWDDQILALKGLGKLTDVMRFLRDNP